MPYREHHPSLSERFFSGTSETMSAVCYLANETWAYMLISLIGEQNYYALRHKKRQRERDKANPFRLSSSDTAKNSHDFTLE